MDQKTVVHLHNGILHSRKSEFLPFATDGTAEYYAKRNKPGGKRKIPCDVTYKRNLMNKIN